MPCDPLLAWLVEQEGGEVSFERFMEFALHDPQAGYYARKVRTVGRRGDFSTAATLSPVLGRAIAAWAAETGPLPVIEVGAGDGALAAVLLESGVETHLVEVSEPLRALQQQRLSGVRWHADMASALAAVGGRALVFSNELVDAFPCAVLRRGETGWQELVLRVQGELVEAWRPFSGESPLVEATGRVEQHRSYRRWLEGWLPGLERGHLLTIDYGEAADTLYHRRPMGTVRGYFQHLRMEGPEVYARVGHQDLTADVNFTELRAWGEALGLSTRLDCTQREFVLARLPELADSADPAVRFVLHPHGMGGGHRVLWQERA